MAQKIPIATSMQQLKEKKHQIGKAKAVKMAKKYQKFRKELEKAVETGTPLSSKSPALSISYAFNAKSIKKLLKEPTAVGIRIYPGVNEENNVTMILVAFDADGNNITYGTGAVPVSKAKGLKADPDDEEDSGILDDGMLCPPQCGPQLPE
jgi:hypothetical protein